MAFFSGTIYSESMNMDTGLGVILPHDTRCRRGLKELHRGIRVQKKPKTLILLHGLSDNYSAWSLRTSVLRYAEAYDLAVLMPEVQRSYYQDMKNGPAYFSYITGELPAITAELFNLSVSPEDLMIAGLSMGGYGALYAGLRYPEKFCGVGCFSSGFDLRSFVEGEDSSTVRQLSGWDKDRRGIFGEDKTFPDSSDLYKLAVLGADNPKKPRIFMTCGTGDFLHECNLRMRDLLASTGAYDLRYEEWPGIHEWDFWDTSLQKMLAHFLVPEAAS
jgi:S-formylglutathione hydrolase FrmB